MLPEKEAKLFLYACELLALCGADRGSNDYTGLYVIAPGWRLTAKEMADFLIQPYIFDITFCWIHATFLQIQGGSIYFLFH